MSASILWEPVNKEPNHLSVGSKESFLTAMEVAGFSDLRRGSYTFSEVDLHVLRGMLAVHGGVNINNPYWQLIEAIDKYGSIRVWAQY